MDTVEYFKQHKYVYLIGFLPENTCKELVEVLKTAVEENKTVKDPQCPLSEAIYGHPAFDKLLETCLPYLEKASGLELIPTYSYARLYAPEDELKIHRDRPSCEISATVTLGFEDGCWSIYMGDSEDKSDAVKIDMNVGDAVLYRGMEKWHWREKFEGKWQAQVFLHYVDKNGKYAHLKYDNRGELGTSKETLDKNAFDICYTVPNAISHSFCDNIIKEYSKDTVEKELPYIGNGDVNYDIRNVKRVILPMNVGVGAALTATGLNANHEFWKFNITHSNQTEFLMYEVDGKYEEHIDTEMKVSSETRKLTVIAILNDDFEGGKFYIKNSGIKVYPKQDKGDIIVFPSFLAHGVEPITKGQRFSVVTWLVGPWFN